MNAPAHSRVSLRDTKLLVVEDNPHALEILMQVLVGFGIGHMQTCVSAEEGLAAAGKARFDLILLDAEMPTLDGISFTRRLRADPKSPNFTAPVIILSGCPLHEKIAEARDAGANIVIAKPIVPKVLLGRILWVARGNRDFVVSDSYRGPDRRFRNLPLPEGMEERRAHAKFIQESPERDLSQEEIDSLF